MMGVGWYLLLLSREKDFKRDWKGDTNWNIISN